MYKVVIGHMLIACKIDINFYPDSGYSEAFFSIFKLIKINV